MIIVKVFLLLNFCSVFLCLNLDKIKLLSLKSNAIVQIFQEYLRIDTSRPENIVVAVEFWRRQAASLPNAEFYVHELAGNPISVIKVPGSDSTLPAIMLSSHMDVVGVEPKEWKHPPFSGHIDDNGDIFGRGAQDTKDISIQYLEALRILQQTNNTLRRNVFMILTPDEEPGGQNGMKVFVATQEFHSMNIGYALDEGLTRPDNSYLAAYLDKRPWQIRFTTYGTAGHGSTLAKTTAVDKLEILLSKIKEFRNSQTRIAESKEETDYGSYTSVNVNILQAGYQTNVIPTSASLVVDMRLAVNAEVNQMEQLIHSWVTATGNDTTVEFIRREDISVSARMDETNQLWNAVQEVVRDMNSTVKAVVSPAVSDMMYVRATGIPALGFSTRTNTINRMHAHDEYMNAETLINGVQTYVHLIRKLGNLP